jgi:predicted XRE-type DNA-binding protein
LTKNIRITVLPEEKSAYQQRGQGDYACALHLHAATPQEPEMTSKIDTSIEHITPAGTNIFLDLGFSPEEAERLYADSSVEIAHAIAIKEQLMEEISRWIAVHQLKQAEVAKVLHISRPRVSDVVNKKISKFTIDALVNMLSRIGKPVTVLVG